MVGMALCSGQLNGDKKKKRRARGCLTITVMIMGKSRGLLIICQDICHHELPPLSDGPFTQRRHVPMEI